LTTEVEDGLYKRIGTINFLGQPSDEFFRASDHVRICTGTEVENRGGMHWWEHLEKEYKTLRLS